MRFFAIALLLISIGAQADSEVNCHIPGTNDVTPCHILRKELASTNVVCFKPKYDPVPEYISDYISVTDHSQVFTLNQYLNIYGRQKGNNGNAISYYFIHGDCNYYDVKAGLEEAAPVKMNKDVLCYNNASFAPCRSLKEFQDESICVRKNSAGYLRTLRSFLGKNYVLNFTYRSWPKFKDRMVVYRNYQGNGRFANLVPLCGE